MKKTLCSFVAFAAIVTTGFADDWFNGNIGATATGGSWDSGVTGVTLDSNKYVLEDVESFKFSANDSKAASSAQNLKFETSVNFKYAYDELPDVGDNDKAGVIAYVNGTATNYWVLATNVADNASTKNVWADTGIAANLADSVAVAVVISNGANKTWAIYTFDNSSTFTTNITTAASSFKVVDYSGCGTIGSLVGSLLLQGYPIPGGKTIPQEAANAWAESMGYEKADLAKMLSNENVIFGNRTAAESCILGVATNGVLNSSIDDVGVAGNKLQFTVQCTPISGRATFQLKKDSSTVGEAQSERVFNPDLEEGEYSIVAFVDGANKEIPASKTIGVKNAPSSFGSAKAAGFCAVPYTGADGAIAISNLFKKALLANGDQLDIYDSASTGWASFRFNGTIWTGVPKNDVTPDPSTTTIKRGQAFKLTRPDSVGLNRPVYLGYVSTEAAKVTLPSKKYELVAMSGGSDFPLEKAAAVDQAVKVDVGAKVPNVVYKQITNVWTRIEYAGGKATGSATNAIDGAFFLMNRGSGDKEIDFSESK